MKNLLMLFSFTVLLLACKEKNPAVPEVQNTGGTASFKADNTSYTGKVETQYFGRDKETSQFSVTCQQDEPYTLLQITFANEKAAVAGNTFRLQDDFMHLQDNEVNISLSGTGIGDLEYVSQEEAAGSVSVRDHVITLKEVKLANQEGKEITVNAQLSF